MENHIVKNVEALRLTPADLEVLAQRAEMHLRDSNITFKVLEVTPENVVLAARQGYSQGGNICEVKHLIDILRETFGDLVGDRKINPRPSPFRPSPPDVVTPEWLKTQQRIGSCSIAEIADELGLARESVAAYIHEERPPGRVARAMFYYYFTLKNGVNK